MWQALSHRRFYRTFAGSGGAWTAVLAYHDEGAGGGVWLLHCGPCLLDERGNLPLTARSFRVGSIGDRLRPALQAADLRVQCLLVRERTA